MSQSRGILERGDNERIRPVEVDRFEIDGVFEMTGNRVPLAGKKFRAGGWPLRHQVPGERYQVGKLAIGVVEHATAADDPQHRRPAGGNFTHKGSSPLPRWIDEELARNPVFEALDSLPPGFVMNDREIEIAVEVAFAANNRACYEDSGWLEAVNDEVDRSPQCLAMNLRQCE